MCQLQSEMRWTGSASRSIPLTSCVSWHPSFSTDWRRHTCLVTGRRWLLFLVAVNYSSLMPTNCLLLEHSGHDHSRSLGRRPGMPFLPRSETLIRPFGHSSAAQDCSVFCATDLLIAKHATVTVRVKCCVLNFLLLLLLLLNFLIFRKRLIATTQNITHYLYFRSGCSDLDEIQ